MIKIIGDIMLDVWVSGNSLKVSPEASVLVLKENHRNYNVGGAGNLALNLSNLGADTCLYSCVGKDTAGHKIKEIMLKNEIKFFASNDAVATTTKTRMIGMNGQHLLRLDREEHYEGSRPKDLLLNDLTSTDIVIVSDYNKGIVDKELILSIKDTAKTTYVDPKQEAHIYHGVYCVKPNMKEYEQWFGKFTPVMADINREQHNWSWLIVTDGAEGIHVVGKDLYKHIKGDAVELADVSGAGDTVLAIIVYYHEKGVPMIDACELALKGATKVVQHKGVTVVKKTDVEDKIVWTNGVFDIIHNGHLELLKFSKQQGDKLVVGINSDDSVKRLKGNNRPFNNAEIRKQQLLQLPWIDEVIIFEEDTPINSIMQIKPDIIVKGGDYTEETTVGHNISKVIIFPTVQGFSTTNIMKKIKGDGTEDKK